MRLAAASVILGVVACVAAAAAQVRFTGNTTADTPLIQDALQHVLLIAEAKFKCTSIEGVTAEVLPQGFVPPPGLKVESGPQTTYELWTATICGTPVDFLVTFWSASDGGTMFAVGFPFDKSANAS